LPEVISDPQIKLVCFDLGGVVIRICRSWDEGCAAAGLPVRRGDMAMNAGVQVWQDLIERHQTGKLCCDEYAAHLSSAMEGLYSPAEIVSIHRSWLLGEYEGVADLIQEIHHAGCASACLSNTNHAHWEQMQKYPAFTALQHRLASHELKLHKPDTAIYQALEAQLGFRGREILFFDDLPENIHAADRAGWRTCEIDHGGDTAGQIRAALIKFHVLAD
jgi:HAD superfamily hydrolase (TIGR01509 family)